MKMANKNSLSGSKDLDKKFGIIGVLLFLSEGMFGLILTFIYNDIIFLGGGITLIVIGLIFFIVIQKKPQLKIMPDKMPLAIFSIIFFIIIRISFFLIIDSSLKSDIVVSLYYASIPVTLAGWMAIGTVLLKIKK